MRAERRHSARVLAKIFTVVFYGAPIFCCKTAQFGATLRELTQVRPSLKNTLRKTVKACANTR
jgi:hypothetical protein